MNNNIEEQIKSINKIHYLGIAVIIIVALLSIISGANKCQSTNGIVNAIKGITIIFVMGNIIFLWWKYDNTVKNKEYNTPKNLDNTKGANKSVSL